MILTTKEILNITQKKIDILILYQPNLKELFCNKKRDMKIKRHISMHVILMGALRIEEMLILQRKDL